MPDKTRPAKSKTPRKITESSLRNIALFYLQRYSSSQENLRQILMRRVHRSAYVHEMDIGEASAWVDQLVDQLAESGMVNDETYAEGRMRALFRRGLPPKAIAQQLRGKGIEAELIETTMAKLYEDATDPNLLAAIKFAKRRRLGPYRKQNDRNDRAEKDLAALARAGFDYGTARTVISAGSEQDLDELAIDAAR